MASFTLLVRTSPFAGVHHQLAQDFVASALRQGHDIRRVFFYQDAVYAALNTLQPVQGQISVTAAWQQLASSGKFPLQVCIANALRRGVADEQEQKRYDLPCVTCANGFELAGLGEMATATADSDRIVEF